MVRGEIIIDLSNWPNHAKFMDGLPDDVNDYTEEQWLNLIIPNQDVGGLENNSPQKAYDNFLAIRRKLTELKLLADYNAVITQDEMVQIINNLKDPAITNGIKPNVAVVLGATFRQLEADTHGLGTPGGCRVGINNDNDDTQTVAYFNVMMCCLSETIVKEGKGYLQSDGFFGPISIVNHLWPILTGSNEEKEFKLYLLIKIFYFDSKLYKFIDPTPKFESMTYGTEMIPRTSIYEDNTLSPVHIFTLFFLHLWLRNKKASQYNSLSKQNKIGFCQSFVIRMNMEQIGNSYGSLGGDGSIKTILAKYLVNRDPIYLFSAALSPFTDPDNIFPGFDDISNTFNVLIPDRIMAPGFILQGPDFTMNLMLFIGAWKAERGLEGDVGIRNTLNIDYIEKLYKTLSKPVIFKKQKMSKFIKTIALFKKNFIPIVNLSPKLISKLENMDNIIYNDNNSLIKEVGFYIKPIKSGYNQDEENEGNAVRQQLDGFVGSDYDKIYLGGGSKKYTRKKRRKNKRKTLKL